MTSVSTSSTAGRKTFDGVTHDVYQGRFRSGGDRDPRDPGTASRASSTSRAGSSTPDSPRDAVAVRDAGPRIRAAATCSSIAGPRLRLARVPHVRARPEFTDGGVAARAGREGARGVRRARRRRGRDVLHRRIRSGDGGRRPDDRAGAEPAGQPGADRRSRRAASLDISAGGLRPGQAARRRPTACACSACGSPTIRRCRRRASTMLRRELGDAFIAVEIDSSPGNAYGIPKNCALGAHRALRRRARPPDARSVGSGHRLLSRRLLAT